MESRELFWARAAVFGALWGAVEITLGGFLHSLRLPLIGVILATGEAGFLVAVRRMYPERGLVVAIALIAALLRGLTPLGALFSPLIAIFMEGVLVELAFLVLPGVRLPAAVGGALCALWSVAQMVVSHAIFFGLDALRLYDTLLCSGARLTGVAPEDRYLALVVPLSLLAVIGMLGGLWGARLGNRVRQTSGRPLGVRT
jgi:hypothetical protein